MRRVVLLLVAVGAVSTGVASSALGASSVTLCVPTGEGAAITTPTGGSCGSGTSVLLPSEPAEQKKLISILPYINYEAEGIDKKPTIQFSGANLQIINGSGVETTLNGTGNLILGYDEKPGTQIGSHNLLLGSDNSYSSYGGIVGGHNDNISGSYASILSGGQNTASGVASAITGGNFNKASASYSAISGGCSNLAGTGTVSVSVNCTSTALKGYFPSILGGAGNQASAIDATVSGGKENKATGEGASISGGGGGEASAPDASVVGGRLGKAKYFASTVLGELEEETEAEFGVTP